MATEGRKALVFEALDTLFKSWWTIVAGICFGIVGALLVLSYVDKWYQAATLIRVAPQSIPEDFVRSTVTDDMSERLLEIERAILSRAYMDQLIEKTFGVPENEEQRQALTRMLRARITVDHPHNTRLCSLVYRDTDAARAAEVVNTLTSLYIEQNQEFRANQAENTRETFEDRAAAARQELDEVEQQLSEFNTRHRHETEGFLDANLKLLENRREQLDANQREQDAVRLRVENLTKRLEQGGLGPVGPIGSPGADSPARRIRDLRRELADLRSRYADTHPDVRNKQRELDQALAALGGAPAEEGAAEPPLDPERESLESDLKAEQLALDHLREETVRLRREIAAFEARINNTPEIQAQLSELEEQRRILQERYRDLKDKAERARSSEFLEESKQGQRLEVIEWAAVPFRPSFPDPVRIFTLGILAGCLLFIGPIVLRSVLNPLVTSEAGLRGLIEVPVLVGIPRLMTRNTAGLGRRRLVKNLGLSLVSSAVLLAVLVVLRGG